jgi:hypothetical protein
MLAVNSLMECRDSIAVYFKNYTKPINTLCSQYVDLLVLHLSVCNQSTRP